ncbi:MAG TPA: glycosyltransferase [Blastocatellia bacterium]|nr:glycosyltransferase [Blastocatellia bacterium]
MSKGRESKTFAVRALELSRPIPDLTDAADHSVVRLFVMLEDRPIGFVDIPTYGEPISAIRLRDAIISKLHGSLIREALAQRYALAEGERASEADAGLPSDVSVSVVVATYDRPDDLRRCLQSLLAQVSLRRVEVIVVDNHPASGLTRPVATEFSGVVLVEEERKGLSYARNKGITASRGDIIITTDDDVTMPPCWLEKLVAPFARSDVMGVTGNVLPAELETWAQYLFEVYGGLGRGFERRSFDRAWFDQFRSAVPTWRLGATANAAFRVEVFSHPRMGLFDETLGAGTPTGCSEDTFLFYRVLKAGYAIAYEPAAYVWHRHRREMAALRHQIYNYSKGHVAYHLLTYIKEGDRRALARLGINLPQIYMKRFKDILLGQSEYPLSLLLTEMAGNLMGPWSLWMSRRRVSRVGPSEPYVPASQRSAEKAGLSVYEANIAD